MFHHFVTAKLTPPFSLDILNANLQGKNISKNKKIRRTSFFFTIPYVRYIALYLRLRELNTTQTKGFSPIVVTTIGKQRPCHCLFIFIKKQNTYPFTQNSVAKKVTRNTPIIFSHIECKFTGQEHIKKKKKKFGLNFFYLSLCAINYPTFASTFEKKSDNFQLNPSN